MSTTETSAPIPTVPERITIVLKAQEGSTLEQICQFVSLGMPVAIGRGMAVIAGASDEDLQMVLEAVQSADSVGKERANQIAQKLENVNQQQNAPQNIPEIIPGPWTDAQCLDFCSVALRHAVVEGDLQLSDINDALRYMAEKYQAPIVDSMHIDERVRMAANAKRYEWLCDRTCIEDADNDIMVVRGDKYFDGDELDREIDNAHRLARLQELHP